MPGTKLGDTTLTAELGRGAQAVVYSGWQATMERDVAVKVHMKDLSMTPENIERFRREAEAAGRLNHPNIVHVFGLDETTHYLLLLQELIDGPPLEDVLVERAQKALPIDAEACHWAARICQQIAEALAHAHEHGVVHRDIKPGNVLIAPDGSPKLTDFGLAKVEDKLGLSTTGKLMGTPHYMSPEQVAAKPSGIDARTDVYSLGAMLYRMLTHQIPFVGESLEGMLLDIVSREPQPPHKLQPLVDRDLQAVCLKALEKDPDDRYDSAQQMAEDLARSVRGEPTRARPQGPIKAALRLVRGMATSTLVAVALLVATACVVLDLTLLHPLARDDVALHDARVGLVCLGLVLAAWPLAVLGKRLATGKLRGALPAWAVMGAVAALLAWTVREQATEQRHHTDRAELAAQVRREFPGRRQDVNDLLAYVSAWEPRFDVEDHGLLARAYLKRERPVDSAAWATRSSAAESSAARGPHDEALQAAIHRALGEDELADQAEQRLWATTAETWDWSDWRVTGDILAEMKRYHDAQRAFDQAARLPGADRDALNLDLARVSSDLCQWERVDDHLDDYMKWNPDDPDAHLVAYNIAMSRGDWIAAEEHLQRFADDPKTLTEDAASTRHAFLLDRDRVEDARALVRDSLRDHGDEYAVVAWGAKQLWDDGDALTQRAREFMATGDGDAAARAVGEALDRFDEAEQWYTHLAELEQGAFYAYNGLASVALKRADFDPEARREHLQRAIEEAARAIATDPEYWAGHYNLGHARLNLARTDYGGFAELPLDALQDYVEAMERSLEYNGLQDRTLNNTAWVLGAYVYGLTENRADLDQAIDYARRAARLTRPDTSGSGCPLAQAQRAAHSSAHDTLRKLLEMAADSPGALESARAAAAILSGKDPKRAQRQAEVQRLEQLVGAPPR